MPYWLGIKKMQMMDTRVNALLGLPPIEIMSVLGGQRDRQGSTVNAQNLPLIFFIG